MSACERTLNSISYHIVLAAFLPRDSQLLSQSRIRFAQFAIFSVLVSSLAACMVDSVLGKGLVSVRSFSRIFITLCAGDAASIYVSALLSESRCTCFPVIHRAVYSAGYPLTFTAR